VVVKILKYEFSDFWWGFKVASLLAWPGYLPITLYIEVRKKINSKF
jgi:hypothetical protein